MTLASVAATLLLAAGDAAAAPCGEQSVARWTSEALLPLALVRGAAIEPDKDQCPEPAGFHAAGVRWQAIDLWGRPAGVVENAEDARGVSILRLVSGTRGSGVFVRGAWTAGPSAEGLPDEAQRDALSRWLGKSRAPREVQFFRAHASQVPRAPATFAVVVRRASILVAYAEGKRWHVAFRETYGKGTRWPLYRVRAIADMNGDGLPEIVYHFNEYEDGRGHEVVLAPTRGGRRYHQASDNEDDGP